MALQPKCQGARGHSMAKVNLDEIKKRIDAGLITERKHPYADLYIYNYTPICQFGRNWDEYTLMCRGLILDGEGTIIARPFSKFFNLQEHKGAIPNETFTVAEKMDGSLGIMYPINGTWAIATRGSFTSTQAQKGSDILAAYMADNGTDWINPAFTYLFEIIYPSNRIVIDYSGAERLVLLACINTETGRDDWQAPAYKDQVTFHNMPDLTDPMKLHDLKFDESTANREGFVLHFASGLRLKFKFDEYVRLHRILTETSNTVVWEVLAVEAMANRYPDLTPKQIGDYIKHIDKRKVQPILDKQGKAVDSLLENVPDEFYQWLRTCMLDLKKEVRASIVAARKVVVSTTDRMEIIKLCGDDTLKRTLAFCLLDGKEAQAYGYAWNAARPEFSKPFATDEEA